MVDTVFYNDMANTAQELLAEFGRMDLVLLRRTSTGYDPIEDEHTPGATLTQSITCVVLPVSQGTVEAFDNRLEGGTLIESNLRLLKIPALGLAWEPRAGDEMDFEGSTWTCLGSTPINPAGIPLLFNATFKRG